MYNVVFPFAMMSLAVRFAQSHRWYLLECCNGDGSGMSNGNGIVLRHAALLLTHLGLACNGESPLLEHSSLLYYSPLTMHIPVRVSTGSRLLITGG